MDPNECLRLFANALLEENAEEARDRYNDLRVWMERGGFEPTWERVSRKQFFSFNPSTGMLG